MDYLYDSHQQPIQFNSNNGPNPYSQAYQYQFNSGSANNSANAALAASFYLNRGYEHQQAYSDSLSSSSSNNSLNSSQIQASAAQSLFSSPPSSSSSSSVSSSSVSSASASSCSSLNNSTDYINRHLSASQSTPSPQYPFFASPINHHHHSYQSYLPYANSHHYQHSIYNPQAIQQQSQINDSPPSYLQAPHTQAEPVKHERKEMQGKAAQVKLKKQADESPVSAQPCKSNPTYLNKFYQENSTVVKSTAFITPSLMSIEGKFD